MKKWKKCGLCTNRIFLIEIFTPDIISPGFTALGWMSLCNLRNVIWPREDKRYTQFGFIVFGTCMIYSFRTKKYISWFVYRVVFRVGRITIRRNLGDVFHESDLAPGVLRASCRYNFAKSVYILEWSSKMNIFKHRIVTRIWVGKIHNWISYRYLFIYAQKHC